MEQSPKQSPAEAEPVADLIERLLREEERMQRLWDKCDQYREKHTGTPAAFDFNGLKHAVAGRDSVLPEAAASLSQLSTKLENAESEREYAVGKADELTLTIKRIWEALGNPAYETLNGLTISEVVADWKSRAESAEQERDELRAKLADPAGLANMVANIRQGQSDTPRCEPPGEYDIEIARKWVDWVLAAIRARAVKGAGE